MYVLTQDFFAVCIHEENRPGTSPGGSGAGTGDYRPTPGGGTDRPTAGGTGTTGTGGTTGADRPAGSGNVDRAAGQDRPATAPPAGERTGTGPGGTGATPPAGDRPGTGTAATTPADRPMAGGMTPQNRSYVTVILKRGGGAGAAGAAPDRR